MRKKMIIGLMLCLIQFGCGSGGVPDTTGGGGGGGGGDIVTPGGQNVQDNGTTNAADASFTIQKEMLRVSVDASAVGGTDIQVRWDWTNDGTWDTDWSATKTSSHAYDADGSYTINLEIKDANGNTDTATRHFTIALYNQWPKADFAVNMVQGMTASVDASSSSDTEDSADDLQVRWDWNGDGTYDTDWTTVKTAEHTYDNASNYTINLQVRDLNGAPNTKSQTITASPIAIRSSFLSGQSPYLLKLNFRLINNVTDTPVTQADQPPLTRANFQIYEDDILIDPSETNQLLTLSSRPMNIVLVLDFTGSMYDAGGVPPMIAAAKAFIDGQPDNTHLSLWAFWERQGGYAEIDDFTQCTADGKAKVKADLDAFAAVTRDKGATVIWDVLYLILNTKFVSFDNGVNRAVVFLSDGHDTTSVKTVGDVINLAKNIKAVNIFSVGLAFRPADYPTDEPKLKQVANDTSGIYFTVNQVSDLAAVFHQMADNLQCDWTLSYITLSQGGGHKVEAKCNYLNGIASTVVNYTLTTGMQGDIYKGLLSVASVPTAGGTEYAVMADYIPRNISKFKIRVSSSDASVRLTLYAGINALCTKAGGWTISPDVAAGEGPPVDGWYTLTSISPLEYGSFGKIARCTLASGNLPSVGFELPTLGEQATLYGDKKIVFTRNGGVSLSVPSLISAIPTVAAHGTPTDAGQGSANADQALTVTGKGLTTNDYLVFNTIGDDGQKATAVVKATSAAADGTSMQVSLPAGVCTGPVYLLNAFTDTKLLLQIVPHITSYSAPVLVGDLGRYWGTGIIEGGTRVVAGGVTYVDGGTQANDGIDVYWGNTAFSITSLTGSPTPVYVVTAGGTSVTYGP